MVVFKKIGTTGVLYTFIFSNVKSNSKKGKKAEEVSDSDLDSDDDLDDEELSLGSMAEEDFGDELEEDGGAFMDPGGDDDDEGVCTCVTHAVSSEVHLFGPFHLY